MGGKKPNYGSFCRVVHVYNTYPWGRSSFVSYVELGGYDFKTNQHLNQGQIVPTQAKFTQYNNKHVGADFYYTPNRMCCGTRSFFLNAHMLFKGKRELSHMSNPFIHPTLN